MELKLYQIDAFTEAVFGGNPAAVCPLESWLPEDTLQAIATENNLSETAFFVPAGDAFELRWFTPGAEVDLCGHATLATSDVIFRHFRPDATELHFDTKSGRLTVARQDDGLALNFPMFNANPINPTADLGKALGIEPLEVYMDMDCMAVLGSEADVRSVKPDMGLLEQIDGRGVIVTAPGDTADFVSRFFCPKYAVPEDPVCGSAHCMMTPYWAKRLGKDKLLAHQVSARGGVLHCRWSGDRVTLAGRAVQYLEGTITI